MGPPTARLHRLRGWKTADRPTDSRHRKPPDRPPQPTRPVRQHRPPCRRIQHHRRLMPAVRPLQSTRPQTRHRRVRCRYRRAAAPQTRVEPPRQRKPEPTVRNRPRAPAMRDRARLPSQTLRLGSRRRNNRRPPIGRHHSQRWRDQPRAQRCRRQPSPIPLPRPGPIPGPRRSPRRGHQPKLPPIRRAQVRPPSQRRQSLGHPRSTHLRRTRHRPPTGTTCPPRRHQLEPRRRRRPPRSSLPIVPRHDRRQPPLRGRHRRHPIKRLLRRIAKPSLCPHPSPS